MQITENQADKLARPLVDAILSFYREPESEKNFEEWLKSREGKRYEKIQN